MTAARVLSIAGQLLEAPSLEPGREINALFTELVDLSENHRDAQEVLAHPEIAALIPELRRTCATGEFLLERAWARRIARELAQIRHFPYYDNYERLTRLELHTLAGAGLDLQKEHRLAFLGGGPLPLSAMLMSDQLRGTVDVVEIDPEAAELAHQIIAGTARTSRISVLQADAADYRGEADVLVLAALVGDDRATKRRLLDRLAENARPGTFLLVRSAEGLRTLLYPPVAALDLPPAWRPLALTHPYDAVVNSVLVAVRAGPPSAPASER